MMAYKAFLFLALPAMAVSRSRDPSITKARHGMRAQRAAAAATIMATTINPDDRFNFDTTIMSADPLVGDNYGPSNWSNVHCNDINTCPGYPTNWKLFNPFIPYNETINMCIDCSKGSTAKACAQNKQSPIALYKNITAARLCLDRHRINFIPGNTKLGQVDFQILPHVLRAYQPNCTVWPSADYSWGFPNPWLLRYTDVTVPSQHTIDGKRYSAEIILSHTYSQNYLDTLIGNIAILVDLGTEDDYYSFFELYLRSWEAKAHRIAANCARKRKLQVMETNITNDIVVQMVEPEVETGGNNTVEGQRRRLGTGTQVVDKPYYKGPYYPHMFYKDSNTEYYFRYFGSVIEPPCLEYVHWRVMRLPVKISPSQFKRLNALFLNRLNPTTCEKESAGRVRGGTIKRDVSRPLQTMTKDHKLVYCECVNWRSPKPADVAYCNQTMADRGVFPYSGP
ncbi:hypothetical protein MPSEU_000247000 [Mayamaea pseudoterrestris]|nr:hypothetical protein MPSEU_000247000 [Mayamaea pseudoterrestris]